MRKAKSEADRKVKDVLVEAVGAPLVSIGLGLLEEHRAELVRIGGNALAKVTRAVVQGEIQIPAVLREIRFGFGPGPGRPPRAPADPEPLAEAAPVEPESRPVEVEVSVWLGETRTVSVWPRWTLGDVRGLALHSMGHTARPPEDFEIRSADGAVLSPATYVSLLPHLQLVLHPMGPDSAPKSAQNE